MELKKCNWKKLLAGTSAALSMVLLCNGLYAGNGMSAVEAKELAADSQASNAGDDIKTICEYYEGSNVSAQNYNWNWSSTVGSYLRETSDGGLMRVQSVSGLEGVLVEYYDQGYNLLERKIIPQELPIFGGFYEAEDAYYMVSGQTNGGESDEVEVIRITKYDKQWKRIGSDSLHGANTVVPFDAGSLRMTDDGKYLFIRTCHTMYKSEDGRNHQANVTIKLDMANAKIVDSATEVAFSGYGYVSHSFNQFIKVDDGHVVAVDHGDAYPRCVALIQCAADVTDATSIPSWGTGCKTTEVLKFPGSIGNNFTGGTVGGFEVSDRAYLVAGNYDRGYDGTNRTDVRDIYVASVSKGDTDSEATAQSVSMNWITSGVNTETPQFVPLPNNEYLLLWADDAVAEEKQVYYTKIASDGTKLGETYRLRGALSDCAPLVTHDKIIWYTWDDELQTFYEINIQNIGEHKKTVIENGHKFEKVSLTDGVLTRTCRVCHETSTVKVLTQFSMWWNMESQYGSFDYQWPSEMEAGKNLHYMINNLSPADADEKEMVVEVSDGNLAAVRPVRSDGTLGAIVLKRPGDITISVYPKANPELRNEYKVRITGEINADVNGDDNVDLADVMLALRASLRLEMLTEQQFSIADQNGSGKIELSDAYAILKRALHVTD